MATPVTVSPRTWSVILAGGEGDRVRPLIQRWLGRHRPKQYCTFVGHRSMFQHTVDRALAVTPVSRTVSVIARSHAREAFSQLDGRQAGTVLLQPHNRGTAAGILLPLTHIGAHDPGATVVIFPSDHFVRPEGAFLETVTAAARAAERLRNRIVLLGAPATSPEVEYGWIQPSRVLGLEGARPVRGVHAFLEKPTVSQAEEAMAKGALWNTFVVIARLPTLWNLAARCFPTLTRSFEDLRDALGTSDESRVLEEIYADMPTLSFSGDLLQRVPEHIAVIELSGVMWSDWGKPERIADTIRRIGGTPAFPLECLDEAPARVTMAG